MTAVLQARTPLRQTPARGARPGVRLVIMGAFALAAVAAYYLIDSGGNLDFVLAYRTRKVAALVLVGWAIAVSTVLFHTITTNRILTPSIMGFDSLYVLIQTAGIFFLGANLVNSLGPELQFGVNAGLMLVLSVGLFTGLLRRLGRSVHLLVLVGIVAGTLLRSGAALLQRIMEPNAFLILQNRLFASFSAVQTNLLIISAVLISATSVLVWRKRHALDVLALGPEVATGLGVDHRRALLWILVAVSVLVSVSTALVGPITFFGLLVANLAYLLVGSHRHAHTLVAASLLAVITLVGGQAVLEHVFDQGTVLSVIIEFVGGIVFIALLLGGRRR
ncbi:iron chelate uptake ABC transporter family permease subunit [Ammonicoccus fulvus]|uniref:Iron chelate uptake ABC transporter family permease subunit n=1 Tax=Ammonicoccus fulvus TaxID=3138240 RepID=A0ABZ3FP94_9ACTN